MEEFKEATVVQDNDFKYMLQDTSYLYLGARYSYEELLGQEMVPFKLKTIIEQYLLKDVDVSTTLESHFYYMTPDTFAYKTYRELNVKIKVSLPEEKKGLGGKVSRRYKDKIYTLKEFAQLNLARKKAIGLIVREIVFSKLGLLTFTI